MSTTQTLPLAPLQDALDASEPAQWLKQFCHDRDLPLWVFGGAIRDTLLFCKPGNDLDFYVQTDDTTVLTIKKTLTETFGNTCPIDVVPCSNPIESVYQNDFTCNALLYDPVKQQVLDAYNGLDAIQKRELRIISPPFFFLNPVACFRTFRMAASLGFSIEPVSLLYIQQHMALVVAGADAYRVSRCLLECLRYLSHPNCPKSMPEFLASELLHGIIPETLTLKHSGIWEQVVERATQLETHISELPPEKQQALYQHVLFVSQMDKSNVRALKIPLTPISILRLGVWLSNLSGSVLKTFPSKAPLCYQHPRYQDFVDTVLWKQITHRASAIPGSNHFINELRKVAHLMTLQPLKQVVGDYEWKQAKAGLNDDTPTPA